MSNRSTFWVKICYKTLGVTERRIVSNVIVGDQRFHRRPTLWSRSPSLDLVQLSLDKTIYNIYRLAHPPWTKSSCHSTRRSTTSTLLHHTRVDIPDSVVTRNLVNLPNKHGLTFSPTHLQWYTPLSVKICFLLWKLLLISAFHSPLAE